jgi:hypothetical protein
MDPDPSPIHKIIKSLKKRGFVKEANILEDLFIVEPPRQTGIAVDCPICGGKKGLPCALCEGAGELVSAVPDDEEDQRITQELDLKKQ